MTPRTPAGRNTGTKKMPAHAGRMAADALAAWVASMAGGDAGRPPGMKRLEREIARLAIQIDITGSSKDAGLDAVRPVFTAARRSIAGLRGLPAGDRAGALAPVRATLKDAANGSHRDQPPPVASATPLWFGAAVLLDRRCADFLGHLDHALATFETEDIHDLRVSSRRLREATALFDGCFDADDLRRVTRHARTVTRSLGTLRNLDESHLFFTGIGERLGVEFVVPLVRGYRSRRRELMKSVRRDLGSLGTVSVRKLLSRAARKPHLFEPPAGAPSPFMPITSFALARLDDRIAPVAPLALAARTEENTEAQHRLRVALKRLRYRIEILAPLLGAAYGPVHDRIKAYQDVLGKLHDRDIFLLVARSAWLDDARKSTLLDEITRERHELFARLDAMQVRMPLASAINDARRGLGAR